jgi:hypothetical protein
MIHFLHFARDRARRKAIYNAWYERDNKSPLLRPLWQLGEKKGKSKRNRILICYVTKESFSSSFSFFYQLFRYNLLYYCHTSAVWHKRG